MNKVVNSYSINNRLAVPRRRSSLSETAATVARPALDTFPRQTPVYLPGRAEAREKVARRAAARRRDFFPTWIIFASLVAFTFVLCVIVNVNSRSEMHNELQQQQLLDAEIKQLQNDNSAIADEVRRLQSDPATIERAARERLNMGFPGEKVLVSVR